jgi:hypothetical protein
MQAVAPKAETVWFTTMRSRILIGENTYSLVEQEAEQGNMPPLQSITVTTRSSTC